MTETELAVGTHDHVKAVVLVEVGYAVAVQTGGGREMPGALEWGVGGGIGDGYETAADFSDD